ncbi:YwaF family protein [Mycoplasmopsis caviae]|uniref:Predicted integral membrane protein n=1 Tax=Mycoplasmopsis caviae TaxID=55603 RepID=A0A3P8LB17_9BACT|nr:YwaF family protein [Mycoplasmopsis caviae]UUD35012.1 YwaF family protein [Mycoplasmopsis caviae]VDR42161.1 Predicted integral membrane protein [Mycoplasmopsis caviae]
MWKIDPNHPKGFLSYTGNKLNFSGFSYVFFFIVTALTFISVLLIWLFRREIKKNYEQKEKILFLSKRIFWLICGSIILIGMIIHIVILSIDKFYNYWEYLPLHFCRIMLLFIALSLITNRMEYVKYYGYLAIICGLLALMKPDFNFLKEKDKTIPFPIGIDNIYYWDYIFAHCSVVIIPTVFYALSNDKIKFKDTLYSGAFFVALALIIFFLNWAVYTYASDFGWKTINYWYLGKDEFNGFKNFFGPLSRWPFNILTYIVLGAVLIIISTIFYCVQDKVYLAKEDNKWVFKWAKSENWKIYKNSFSELKSSKSNNTNLETENQNF